jgi:hypothetical protein
MQGGELPLTKRKKGDKKRKMCGGAGCLTLYREQGDAMQHARLSLKKKPVAEPSHRRRRYRKGLHSPEIIDLSATGSVGRNTPRAIVLLFSNSIYACTYRVGCISASHRCNRINQSFSSSSAKLRGLNCYKMSHRQHAPN